MKKIAVALFLLIPAFTFAKQDDDSSFVNDVNQIKPIFEDNLDSLLNLYYVQHSSNAEEMLTDPGSLNIQYTNIPDSVYAERLARLHSRFKLTYNPIVRNYIEMYTQRKQDRVGVMIGLTEYYFPLFDDIFDMYGVPTELKYMSIIESALNPRARSRTRAIGIWQFMYGTGIRYGLNVSSLVDERRDPIKETHAAAKYSKDLYNIFGDWQLVVAAYNCGPGNVNKAIRRAGGKRDFWEIYRYLPRETRGHVPAFIAAAYTMNYYKEHNIVPVPSSMPLKTDTLMVNQDLHLMQVAEVLKLPIEQLRDLNPQYIHDIIPGKYTPYPLMLPNEHVGRFIDLQDSIYAYNDAFYFNPQSLSKSPDYTAYKKGGIKPKGNFDATYYIVRTGDNLGAISEKFNCRVSDLMDWNDLYSSRIRAGQRLVVYVRKTATQNKAAAQTLPAVKTTEKSGNFITYIVKEGDTLWDIAKQYPGITDDDIRKWNNINYNTNLMPGQQLKIKVM